MLEPWVVWSDNQAGFNSFTKTVPQISLDSLHPLPSGHLEGQVGPGDLVPLADFHTRGRGPEGEPPG